MIERDTFVAARLSSLVDDRPVDVDERLRTLPQGPTRIRPRRLVPILTALLVAAAAIGLLVWAFTASPRREPASNRGDLIVYVTSEPPVSVPRHGFARFAGSELAVVRANGSGRRVLTHLGDRGLAAIDPAWSPDGRRIVFVAARVVGSEARLEGTLEVMNADGSGLHRLGTATTAADPAWSPDGGLIAFTQDDGAALAVIPSAGGPERVIDYRGRHGISGVTWFPGTNTIGFVEDGVFVAMIDADGAAYRRLPTGPHEGSFAWSPDGRQAVVAAGDELVVTALDLTRRRVLLRCERPCRNLGDPVWSPDGRSIVFVRQTAGRSVVEEIRPDGSGLRSLGATGWARSPRWQPSGRPPAAGPPPTPAIIPFTAPRGATKIELGRGASAAAFGFGSVWVTNLPDVSVQRVDPSTNRMVATIPVRGVESMAFGGGSAWTAGINGTLSRIDPSTNAVTGTSSVGYGTESLTYGSGSLWVLQLPTSDVSDAGDLLRIDPATLRVTARITVHGYPHSVVAVGPSIWVLQDFDAIQRVDPATNGVAGASIQMQDRDTSMFAAGGSLWITSQETGDLLKIDPVTGRIVRLIPLNGEEVASGGNFAAVPGDGVIWAYGSRCCAPLPLARMWRVDPTTATARRVHPPTGGFTAAGAGSLWLAGGSAVYRFPEPSPPHSG